MARFYIYMVCNSSKSLYVGLTTDVKKIMEKHRKQNMASFRGNFMFNKLIYVEETRDIHHAIRRELELKNCSRQEKNQLLEIVNPECQCLLKYWIEQEASV